MSSTTAWLFLLLFPIAWWWMNGFYSKIHGRRLKTRYAWASHGALLWAMRIRKWERE